MSKIRLCCSNFHVVLVKNNLSVCMLYLENLNGIEQVQVVEKIRLSNG